MRKLMMMLAFVPVMALLAAAPALAQENGGATVTVRSGDTLSSLAGELFGDSGRWTALYEANQDQIGDSSLIYPGQVLRVPAAGQQVATEPAAAEPVAAERATAEPVAAERATAEPAPAVAPADTTMYLTVPKMGLYDVPVVEGTSEASLSQGAGHLSGTGYPWVAGSNTYIAGHRIGYPGTASDMVFWDLPNLVAGDEIILTDSAGQSYTYAVSNILEVSPSDTSVTAPTGADMVSLQTCTEDFGDYWTAGPNWLARYVVQAERVA